MKMQGMRAIKNLLFSVRGFQLTIERRANLSEDKNN